MVLLSFISGILASMLSFTSLQATNLAEAALSGQLEEVRRLLGQGKSPDEDRTKEGFPALAAAAKENHLEIVELLVEKGAQVNLSFKEDCRAIYGACLGGHVRVVEFLLGRGATIPSKPMSFLTMSLMSGQKALIEMALQKGEDINASSFMSPVGLAIFKGLDLDLIEWLLKKGLDPNGNSPYMSPFMEACAQSSSDVVRLLLRYKADINQLSTMGEEGDTLTPLKISAKKGDLDMVRLLLTQGANPNVRKENETTALVEAAARGHRPVVDELLKAKADPNLTSSIDGIGGVTALMIAATREDTEMVKLLLQYNADRSLKSSNGKTALDWATTLKRSDVVALLK